MNAAADAHADEGSPPVPAVLSLVVLAPVFLLSGATGLVYEIVWSRMLALVFGTTLPAVTTVLAAFMAGLALGSVVLGRLADHRRRLLGLYGLLEIGIGVYAFFVPVVFELLRDRLPMTLGDGSLGTQSLRFAACFLILLAPTTLMGGTLPILSAALVRRREHVGQVVGLLYALNTAGAVIGTLLAGFVAIRFLGMRATIACAGTLNIVAGCVAIALDRRSARATRPAALEPTGASEGSSDLRFVLLAYAVAGAAALVCEVAWTRVLTLVLGSSVYAFTAMLATFLLGLALGSAALSAAADRSRDRWQLFAALEIAVGLAVLLSIVMAGRLPVVYLRLYAWPAEASFVSLQALTMLLSALVVLVPTCLMGGAFPVAARLVLGDGAVGNRVGRVYFVNTVGGIAGSVLAGFVLVPVLGTHRTLELAALAFVGIGLATLWRYGQQAWPRRAANIAALAALSLLLAWEVPSWDRLLMTSGVYVYASDMREGFSGQREFLYYREGRESLVAVTEHKGIRSLRINGKTDGSTGGDMTTQVLLAQLPLLARPDSREVLIIGLGTGVTAGSALRHPGVRVRCLEIDPAVVEAAEFFADVNGHVLSRPELTIVSADARTWLARGDARFDVLISEPSNPWIVGVANLFTLEHFANCRRRLAPDGAMCQWVHSYFMSTENLRLILRTFLAAFPRATLWEATTGDFLLLAGPDHRAFDATSLELRPGHVAPAVMADLARVGIRDPAHLAARQLLGADELRAFAGDGPLNTDDRPLLEFLSPMSVQQDTHATNMAAIRAFQSRLRVLEP